MTASVTHTHANFTLLWRPPKNGVKYGKMYNSQNVLTDIWPGPNNVCKIMGGGGCGNIMSGAFFICV